MVDVHNLEEDTLVRNMTGTQVGSVIEVKLKRPTMVKVQWGNGEVSWHHPEQLSRPNVAVMPAVVMQPKAELPRYEWTKRPEPIREPQKFVATHDQRQRILARLVGGGMLKKWELSLLGISWPPKKGWKKRLFARMKEEEKMLKPSWAYGPPAVEIEKSSMKKLYQQKSGDYSY